MAKLPYPFSVCQQCCSGSGGGGTVDVSGKEDKSNKVTVITANETAEKYPNVHAVINYLQSHGMTEAQAVECIKEYFKYNSAYMHEVIAGILLTTPAIHVGYVENWGSVLRISQSGKATSLQADLDTKSDKMRLLNTYTFEEERVDVTFTQTDDGAAYKDIPLKKYIIHTYVPKSDKATTTVYNAIYLKFTQENPYYTTGVGLGTASITNTDAQYAVVEADVDKKILFHSGGGAKNGYDGSMRYHTVLSGTSQSIGYVLKRVTNPIIEGIKWQSGDANTPFPIGTIIEIWGCA